MEQKRNKEDLQQQQGTTKKNQGLTPRENDQDITTAADKNKQGKMQENEKSTGRRPNSQQTDRNRDDRSRERNR